MTLYPQSLNEIDVVTRTVYGEARGESKDGQAAVAWVIRNRAAAGVSLSVWLREITKEIGCMCIVDFIFQNQ
ncbi:unnamed protein product [Rotaria magnacalcarata]|uniref:Uncharacterized protein n=1 Tax=Rotaria magnacalcarata TaxID=392030 RepID=A0A8S2L316_9BILA|nr:unnamed protein product [Rotaria magnacalcarata]